MLRTILRASLGAFLLVFGLSLAAAQDLEDIRPTTEPKTALEYWDAITLEVDVGRPDLATKYLRGLLARKFSEKELLTIVDRYGMTPVLKLRKQPRWHTDPKIEKQARADVDELIQLIGEANRKKLGDPDRIRELIALLRKSPEERIYAINELRKSGAAVVPFLIEAYLTASEPAERLAVRQAMGDLRSEVVPPLLAALDAPPGPVNHTLLKSDILDVLRTKHVGSYEKTTPHLWFLAASPDESPELRRKAKAMLASFLNLPASRLPTAKVALTRQAERYYQGKEKFADPAAVPIWRWEGRTVVQGWPGIPTVTAKQAEEYFGLYFARQALTLDPTYRPAQLVALSLAADKAVDRGGPVKPLSATSPAVSELLAKASPELVIEMLERGIKEKRTGVVLAAVRALGNRAEVRAKRPTGRGDPALVQALTYPDERVKFAAAEALVRIPGEPAPRTAARIVDILNRALSPAAAYTPGSKVLVALGETTWRSKTRQAVLAAGYEPVMATDSRSAMRALRSSSEIEAVLLDSTLPGTGLANLLAQMRQDVDVARVPVMLAAVPESRKAHDAMVHYRDAKDRLDLINAQTGTYRGLRRALEQEEQEKRKEIQQRYEKDIREIKGRSRELIEERDLAMREASEVYVERRQLLDRQHIAAVEVLKARPRLEQRVQSAVEAYDRESQAREEALRRFVSRYPRIEVVHTGLFSDGRELRNRLLGQIRDSGPLSAAERKEQADRAMELLAGMAQGKPAGYDVRPAVSNVLEALRAGTVSADAQIAGLRATSRFDGPRTQETLAAVVKATGRDAKVRGAAVRALVENVQYQGNLLPRADTDALLALTDDKATPPALRDELLGLRGALRPSARTTGEELRRYYPKPAGPLPPPKEKDEKKGKEKDEDKEEKKD